MTKGIFLFECVRETEIELNKLLLSLRDLQESMKNDDGVKRCHTDEGLQRQCP